VASPLNTFKSYAANITTVPSNVYTCPADTTAIVLLAQATNVNASNDGNITFYTSMNGNTELAKDFTIPVGDSAALLSGKLVVEAGNSIGVYANANSVLKLTLSILETQ
jgi:hypothetical protein